MEITNTIVTRSAVQKTEGAHYVAEYVEENGKLLRMQCNIYQPVEDTELSEKYIGSVYLERRMVSCSLNFDDSTAEHFEVVMGMIGQITENIPLLEEDSHQNENTIR